MFKKTLVIAGLVAIMTTGLLSPVSAQGTSAMDKRIYIGSPTQEQPLKVEFTAVKPSFAVNEAIKFNITGNKKFFLFLFNVNYDTNEAVMILPNKLQGVDSNMYLANQRLQVPNTNAEFFSDRPGLERIVMVATTKYPQEISLSKYKRAGSFYITEAKTVQNQLKAIQLRGAQIRSSSEEVFIKEFDLPIHASTHTATQTVIQSQEYSIQLIPATAVNTAQSTSSVIIPAVIPPIASVSTDKVSYQSGEALTISFAANQDGWVSLYTKNSQGNYEQLVEKPVKANVMNYIKGVAGRKGQQEIMSVFSKAKGYKINVTLLESQSAAASGKGFVIEQPAVQQSDTQTVNKVSVATAIANFWVY